MDNLITVIIIGVYTLVYIVVFIIQKTQIDKQKEVVASMKSFMDIFKVDEVKKYADMRIETFKMQIGSLLNDDEKAKEMIEHIKDKTLEPIQQHYTKIMGNRYDELLMIVIEVIMNQERDKREQFIKDFLPENEHYILPMLKEIEDNTP